jgi:hypothetical protein
MRVVAYANLQHCGSKQAYAKEKIFTYFKVNPVDPQAAVARGAAAGRLAQVHLTNHCSGSHYRAIVEYGGFSLTS